MASPETKHEELTCYSTMDASRNHIRILTLQQGSWDDPITCSLAVHSLDDNPKYKPLSYAWGDVDDKTCIKVDNLQLEVPSNLAVCLRYLRSENEALSLWADAICINQSDLEERAQQVSIMGDIFRNGDFVYIWMGIPEHSSQADPFQMVQHFFDNKHIFELPGCEQQIEDGTWAFNDNVEYQRMWNAFMDFMMKSWWTRLWCVQELLLSHAAIVVLGKWTVPWEKVPMALKNHIHHKWGCCAHHANLIPAKYTLHVDRLVTAWALRTITSSRPCEDMDEPFDRIIRQFRYKISQNPRDRVYALLGLLKHEDRSSIQPDYSAPVATVYLQAMEKALSDVPRDLKCLTGSGFNSKRFNLPSWVRNFAAPLSMEELNYEMRRSDLYLHYGGTRGQACSYEIHGNILSLTGTLIDEIEHIGKLVRISGWHHMLEVIKSWARIEKIPLLDCEDPLTSRHQRFWRTIIADLFFERENHYWRRPGNSSIDSAISADILALVQSLRTNTRPAYSPLCESMDVALYRRTFFRTKRGRFGLGFPTMRVGDEVWGFQGGRVPFVVRSKNEVGGDALEREFVGECYLEGCMDGQPFEGHEGSWGLVKLI